MRPLHCTLLGLRPAISPNVGNSGAQFMVVGVCVRAAPVLFLKSNVKRKNEKKKQALFVICGCIPYVIKVTPSQVVMLCQVQKVSTLCF